MARIRTIKPSFFTSEDVTALEPLARLLFVGLFTEADRDGRVEDRPKTLKMRLLPGDDVDVDALLWSLVDGGLIRRYEANGVRVIQVRGFEKHQRPHPKEPASELPTDGTDAKKPCKETASRERVAMHPVETQSSPVGREGKEYGVSLREGKGREGDGESASRGAGLILSPREYARLQESHAYVGQVLRVPKVLHSELQAKSGVNADQALLAWYGDLDLELERTGKGTGDVFKWLRPRHQAFAESQGWIDAPSKVNGQKSIDEQINEWAQS